MTNGLTITTISWQEGQSLLAPIRYSVFVQEQKVPEAEEWDEADATAVHFLALYQSPAEDEPIACARLLANGKVGRMAVMKDWRTQGIATALLHRIIRYAQEHQHKELFLDAQVHALAFYEKLGFVAEGPEFMDAGIPHRRMRRKLQPGSSTVTRLQGGSECLAALRCALSDARHSLDVLSDHLETGLYAAPDVVDLVSALARRSRRSQVRILVKDTQPLRSQNHPLVQIAQRLPSRIELRGLSETPRDADAGYCIVDKRRLVYLNHEAELVGFSNFDARSETRRLLEEYDSLWERYSFSDTNLRQLHL